MGDMPHDHLPIHLQQDAHGFRQAVQRCRVSRKSRGRGPAEDLLGPEPNDPAELCNGYLHRVDSTVFGSLQKLGWISLEY